MSTTARIRLSALAAVAGALLGAAPAAADAPCVTSGPASAAYAVQVCLDAPRSVSGVATVTAAATVTGSSAKAQRAAFTIDGRYLITDFEPPFSFKLDSRHWADGPHTLAVTADIPPMGSFTSDPATFDLTFANGIAEPEDETGRFAPTSGTTPAPGKPFVLAAVGDGAGGRSQSTDVVNLIESWNPNLFLYLGDVYEKGTRTEFENWYGDGSTFFSRLRGITDPTIGNHEWEHDPDAGAQTAQGYFDYWDDVPHSYSFDANGWHFISLDSTSQYNQTAPGSPQYEWLLDDLRQSSAPCTVVYMHHPLFNIGDEGSATRLWPMWRLFDEYGVDFMLVGHDHDYQRWSALDADGNPSATGVTQIISGGGGHGSQTFNTSDARVAAAATQNGALRLELNADGAAFRYVTAGGVTLDSGSRRCTGSPADTAPPQPPAGLSATASGPHRITLRWDDALDNVGVTGYDVYRDGVLLDTVGPDTSYIDTKSVADATTYIYEVRARDALHPSPQMGSDPAVVTTPASSALFSDGFESGSTSKWAGTGIVAQQAHVATGAWGARMTSTGAAASVLHALDAPRTSLYYSLRFKLLAQASTVDLLRFRTAAAGSPGRIAALYLSSTGKLGITNDIAATTSTSTTAAADGKWHTAQVHLTTQGASSQIEVWLDDSPVPALTKTDDYGTTPIAKVELGESTNRSAKAFDVAFDDVTVDSARIDDTAPPTRPADVTATATSGLKVHVGWTASTDDTGVAGYQVYRDGTPLGSPLAATATSYDDTTVNPGSSYYYQVRAFDKANNFSSFSSLDTVETPAAFADDFAGASLSSWTLGAPGVTLQDTHVFTAPGAARAVAGAGAAWAGARLDASRDELYYRLRFELVSQGANPVNLLRFRTAANAKLLTVSLGTTGAVRYTNDVSGVTRTSSVNVATGRWYELQVHLNTATGQVEVWLGAERIAALSSTLEAFDAQQIGQILFGDASGGRTFDLAVDDVLVESDFIPDTTAPTAPTALAATDVGPNRVELGWTAARDNLGVEGYEVFRDGALVATTSGSATAHADTGPGLEPDHDYAYVVRAIDEEGNESADSNALDVHTTGADAEPPTAPAGVKATAASPTKVDVTWNAASDNTAVTGYRILRDGTQVGSVAGSRLTYADASVSQQTTYSYTVKAVDAAGNVSPGSLPAGVTTPRLPMFSDDFERGDVSNWSTTSLLLTGTDPHAGALAARANSGGAGAWGYATLFADRSELTYSLWFKALAPWTASSTTLARLRTSTGTVIAGVYVTSSGRIGLRNEVSAQQTTTTATVAAGGWHQISLHAVVGGASGSQMQLGLDGTQVAARNDGLGTAPVRRLQIGDSGAKTFDVAFDDVMADAPDSTSPPVMVQPPSIGGTAQDGQQLTGDAGTWTGAPPPQPAYQWLRCDSLGAVCSPIAGATMGNHVLTSADVGARLILEVTETNAAGVATARSAATPVVVPAPPSNTSPPSISGTARDGQVLTASNGTWSGTPPTTFEHQWRRCDAAGAGCTDVPGATGTTYTATPADVDSTLRVQVTAANAAGSDSRSSSATPVVTVSPPVNSAPPTVSGTPVDGATLTADPGTWTGTSPMTYAYQWQRCTGTTCSNIGADATAREYVVTSTDVGRTLRVRVTAGNGVTASPVLSDPTATIAAAPPANTAPPTISGPAVDGATLQADRGTWTGTSNGYQYQWRRCAADGAGCADIAGATTASLSLGAADIGRAIRVVVTATNAAGIVSSTSGARGPVMADPPANTGAPTISGAPNQGEHLSADAGTWTGSAPISYAYQWRRCDADGASCADIDGAAAASHTVGEADLGSTLAVTVTATNAGGAVAATSAPTAVVGGAVPGSLQAPHITGTAQDGQTLAADDGTWTGSPSSFARRWQRCDAAGAGCADVSGATGTTYALTGADVGKTVRVVVTATNGGGSASKASAPTGVVAAAAPRNTSPPTISGEAREGQTLTVDPGAWSGSTPMTATYQWQACNASGIACTDIAGATASTFQLNWTQADRTVRARVAMANAAGPGEPVRSGAAGPVLFAAPATTAFADDFESGGLTGWVNTQMTAQQATVFGGSWAARALATGTATWAHHALDAGGGPEIYARMRFRSAGPGWPSSAYVMKLRGASASATSSGTSVLGVYVSSSGNALTIRNDAVAKTIKSAASVSAGDWHEIGLHAVAGGTTGSLLEVHVDGRLALTSTESLGTADIGKVQLGDNTAGRSFDLAFDDLVVQVP